MTHPTPERSPYDRLGGAEGLRGLVERFYAIMDTDPDYAALRALHPPGLDGSVEKLFQFLSGWLGGPPLYVQKHGHPMLRARHLPFAIGMAERDQWMACMDRAMQDRHIEAVLRRGLHDAFARTADHMRNR